MTDEDEYAVDRVVGSVWGCRAWAVTEDGELGGLWSGRFKWSLDSVNAGKCENPEWTSGPHRAAEPGCTCGFYAYYGTEELLPEYAAVYMATGGDVVLGIVEGSGRVLEGTKGFRAENMSITALLTADLAARTDAVRLVADKARATGQYIDNLDIFRSTLSYLQS